MKEIFKIIKEINVVALLLATIIGVFMLNVYAKFLGNNEPNGMLSLMIVLSSAMLGIGFTEILFRIGRKKNDYVTLIIWTIIITILLLLLYHLFPEITRNGFKFLEPTMSVVNNAKNGLMSVIK